jgi:hypothetical protein
VQGPNDVVASFAHQKDNFIWTFFSSVTLALLTLFKTSCFCFAFCRLIRAVFTQRYIETASKDAAVLFKGIGWMNGGILLGAIETIVGFVFFGIPIAYVRRVLRLFSLALMCIGVAKGYVPASLQVLLFTFSLGFLALIRWKTLVPFVTSFKSLTPSTEISGGPSCVNSSPTPASVHFVNYHLLPLHFTPDPVHPLSLPKILPTLNYAVTLTPMLPVVSRVWRVLQRPAPFHTFRHPPPVAETSTFLMLVPGHHCRMDFPECPNSRG